MGVFIALKMHLCLIWFTWSQLFSPGCCFTWPVWSGPSQSAVRTWQMWPRPSQIVIECNVSLSQSPLAYQPWFIWLHFVGCI